MVRIRSRMAFADLLTLLRLFATGPSQAWITGFVVGFAGFGALNLAVGLLLLSRMDQSTSVTVSSAVRLVFGTEIGLVMQVLVIAVLNVGRLPRPRRGHLWSHPHDRRDQLCAELARRP